LRTFADEEGKLNRSIGAGLLTSRAVDTYLWCNKGGFSVLPTECPYRAKGDTPAASAAALGINSRHEVVLTHPQYLSSLSLRNRIDHDQRFELQLAEVG